MTDNKRVTNKQILDKIDALKVGEEGLNALAIKIVGRMMKIQTMTEWYEHVSSSDVAELLLLSYLSNTNTTFSCCLCSIFKIIENFLKVKSECEYILELK